jgi:hypothetical protein
MLIWSWVLAICGCGWLSPEASKVDSRPYYEKIKQWQKRIQKEGWSANIVDDILIQSRRLSRYDMEFDDNWLTPGDFVRSGFKGDCEDIAIFMMGSLKRLGYPHTVRVLVIGHLFADHAQLRVEMPDQSWRWYESTRARSYRCLPKSWQPIVEFDETTIVYYAAGDDARVALRLAP